MIDSSPPENTFLTILGPFNSYGEFLMKWWNCVNDMQMTKMDFPFMESVFNGYSNHCYKDVSETG